MKALVYEGIGKLEYEEVPDPTGDFIVKVEGCGVCGTDLKTFLRGHHFFTPPVILGHEFYGTVIKVPAGHVCKQGDAVVVAPYYECGACDYCRRGIPEQCTHKQYVPGAFCENIAIPADYRKGIFKLPADKAGNEAVDVFTLVEPLACVLNGVQRLHVKSTSRVLVVGGGPMGLLFALYYQQQGIPVVVVEPNEERRSGMQPWGIACVKPGGVDASRFDTVVVAVNKAELVSEYVRTIGDGGTVLAFSGLKNHDDFVVDSHAIHYREVTLTGCSGFALSHFEKSFGIISGNPDHYGKLITRRMPLSEGMNAFSLLRRGGAFKIVLKP